MTSAKNTSVLWFDEIHKDDSELVGQLGVTFGELSSLKIPMPQGFVISSSSYFQFLNENNLTTKIKHILASVDYTVPESLLHASTYIHKHIMQGQLSDQFVKEIFVSYKKISGIMHDASVNIYSSATTHHSYDTSFPIKQFSFLNVTGESNLILKIKESWASLFDARSLFYRQEKKINHFRSGVAVIVQHMVDADKSGVISTVDPLSFDKSKIVIEALFGLNEYAVSKVSTPDRYEVAKRDLMIQNRTKNTQTVVVKKVGTRIKELSLTQSEANRQKITDKQIIALAEIGKKIEQHFYFPQTIHWTISGQKLFITHVKPLTHSPATHNEQINKSYAPQIGTPLSPGIVSGPVKIVRSEADIKTITPHDIVIAEKSQPHFESAIKKAGAMLFEHHEPTMAKKYTKKIGVPTISGIKNLTKLFKNGQIVTVNGTKGELYTGGMKSQVVAHTPHTMDVQQKTATKVYANISHPNEASYAAHHHVDGVGLLRAEHMIASIGTHPKKFIHDKKEHIFIKQIAEQIEIVLKAFYPRPVVYRASDNMSHELKNLIGGSQYEPKETNPLLGYRGAYRHLHDQRVFELELEAIKLLRNTSHLKNIWFMVPFVRTPKELMDIKKILTRHGLHRSPTFKIWMMVEIPSNVLMLDAFFDIGIDGISIGSDDLTMLTLGTDKDNAEVAHAYHETSDVLDASYEKIIKTAHKYHITSSICGRAPSVSPALIEKLVSFGITSISVSPDAIDRTRTIISKAEKKLVR